MIQPLWNNRLIRIGGKPVFNKILADQGLLFVSDVITKYGKIKNWGEMNLKPGSFLAWLGLSNAIPREWLKFLKHPELHFNYCQTGNDEYNLYRVTIGKNVQAIHCLTSRYVYDILMCGKCCIPVIQRKRQKNVNFSNCEFDWTNVYISLYKTTLDTKMREFQYKVINNILPLNKKLYNWKIKDSSRCDLCDLYPESVEHLFMLCIKSVNLSLQLNKLCRDYDVMLPKPYTKEIIFGVPEHSAKYCLVNMILLVFKLVVFQMKDSGTLLLTTFKTKLKRIENIEFEIASSQNKLSFLFDKWESILPLFRSI